MFCSKCGAEIPAGAKFCSVCGAPAPAGDAEAGNKTAPLKPGLHAPAPNTGAGAAAKAGNNKQLLIGVAALAAVVVLLVVLLKGCASGSAKGAAAGSAKGAAAGGKGGFNSPEEAYEAFFNGYCSQDFDLMMSAFPDFWIEYFGGEEAERALLQSNYENDWAGAYEDGLQYISYRATGHTMVSEEEAEQLRQDLNNDFSIDGQITEVATVDYELTKNWGPTKDTEDTSSNTGGYAYKYEGKWYYVNLF